MLQELEFTFRQEGIATSLLPAMRWAQTTSPIASSVVGDHAVLLDDFDRLVQNLDTEHLSLLMNRLAQEPSLILLAARQETYDVTMLPSVIPEYVRIDLSPWNPEQLDAFLGKAAADIDEKIKEILRIPFFAQIYVRRLRDKRTWDDKSEFSLVASFLDSVANDVAREFSVDGRAYLVFLEELAWRIRTKRMDGLPPDEVAALLTQLADCRVRSQRTPLPPLTIADGKVYFAHDLFVEHLVATRILKQLEAGELESLTQLQTGYQEDLFLAHALTRTPAVATSLIESFEANEHPLVGVNVAGILAKTIVYGALDDAEISALIEYVGRAEPILALYRQAVLARVALGTPRLEPTRRMRRIEVQGATERLWMEIEAGRDPIAALLCLQELPSLTKGPGIRVVADRYGLRREDIQHWIEEVLK